MSLANLVLISLGLFISLYTGELGCKIDAEFIVTRRKNTLAPLLQKACPALPPTHRPLVSGGLAGPGPLVPRGPVGQVRAGPGRPREGAAGAERGRRAGSRERPGGRQGGGDAAARPEAGLCSGPLGRGSVARLQETRHFLGADQSGRGGPRVSGGQVGTSGALCTGPLPWLCPRTGAGGRAWHATWVAGPLPSPPGACPRPALPALGPPRL